MTMQCVICGFESLPEMNFCGRCGAQLKRECPECGLANPFNYRFCGWCGMRLATETPPQPAESLDVAGAIPPPHLEDPISIQQKPTPLEGERRQATVILADVYSSTALLEQIGTEAWVTIMNDVLQIIEADIYRFGGEVNQFRGDGLVAFFGATIAHEDDPERAVLAALSMQTAVSAFAARLRQQKGIDLRLRVGVNTGEVIVTSIGNRHQHRESTAMGEAVAIAARLEAAAEPGTVLVSENTYRRAQAHFEWQSLGSLDFKGIAHPQPVYRPLNPRQDHKTESLEPSHIYGPSIPLIGREAEFDELKQAVENLAAGRGGIVLLSGDEGIGKSRLLSEVRRHVIRDIAFLAETREYESDLMTVALLSLVWMQGQCRSYEKSWPYSMWIDLLRRSLAVNEGQPKHEIRQRLYEQAQDMWGEQLTNYYPYMAAFLSLPLEELYTQRIKHLDAKELRRQSYAAIRGWLEALLTRGPLVVVFNNVHWADESSLNLLEYCLSLCDHEAILWIIVIRSKPDSPAWAFCQRVLTEFPHRVRHLLLQPLSETQIGEMIDSLVSPDILSADMRQLIVRKAEGNPYYVEELIRSLVEQGVLVLDPESGQWRATRAVISLDLPDTLQSLLTGRLDSLAAPARQMIYIAAVIGDIFWSNVLKELVDDAVDLKENLNSLQRVQLIEERGRVPDLGMEYAFMSRMMRQVAYESILSNQRAGLHLQVAEYLEQFFNEDAPAQYYSFLAYHFQQAGERAKELFYTLMAAAEAKEAYANNEALTLYGRAQKILDELETKTASEQRLHAILGQKFEVVNERRELFYITGEFQAGRAAAKALLALAQQLDDDPAWMIDALLQQPGVANWINKEELQAGRTLAEKANNLARQKGDHRREMQCLIALTRQAIELNDPAASTHAEKALALARKLNDPYTEAQLLITISSALSWSNEPEQARQYLESAISLCQDLDDKVAEIRLLGQISLQFERNGDYCRLLQDYQQRRLQLCREINHRSLEAETLMICGGVQGIYLGDYEAGLVYEEEARRIWQGTPGEELILLRIIHILTNQGNFSEALATLEHFHQIPAQALTEFVHAAWHITSALLYHAIGDEQHLHQALSSADQAIQLVKESTRLSRQFEMAAATIASASQLALSKIVTDDSKRQSQRQLALELSQTALKIFETFGYAQVIECVSEEVLFRHSQALAFNEQQEEATNYLVRAYDEMMRKYNLIPEKSPYRQSFLKKIPLHRQIEAAHKDNTEHS